MRTAKQQPVIIVVPNGRISKKRLNQLARNPIKLSEDEADYQYGVAAIKEAKMRKEKPVSLDTILRRYGRK